MYAYIINLDRSPDRLAQTQQELTEHGISYERISAVDGRTLEITDGCITGFKAQGRSKEIPYRGSAGCYFSHIKALRRAIEHNVWPCLIVEDDIQICSNPGIPDTEAPIIYFGGIDRPHGTYGGHAICYRTPAAANIVLQALLKYKNTNDSTLVRLQAADPTLFHFCRPYPILQRDGHSLIHGANRRMTSITR